MAAGISRRQNLARQKSAGPVARLTHPDRILFPEQGVTKQDLAAYYLDVNEWMLPHVADRPLCLVRCPGGIQGPCFFQKHLPREQAANLMQVPIREKSSTEFYAVIRKVDDLVSLVQIGTLEIHVWGARTDELERPDRMVFDLDPDPSVSWKAVQEGARFVRDLLAEFDLECFLKTSGGKGLHLVVPLARKHLWPEVKQFSKGLAQLAAALRPARYVATMSKTARHGKVFIDWLRNDRGATTVAPYSTRARKGAPVSVPIDWKELAALSGPAQFSLDGVLQRHRRLRKDPWQNMNRIRQSLSSAAQRKLQSAQGREGMREFASFVE